MSEKECGEVAAALVYWPGRPPLKMCTEHAARAQWLAEAMGMAYLHQSPAAAGDTCTQMVVA